MWILYVCVLYILVVVVGAVDEIRAARKKDSDLLAESLRWEQEDPIPSTRATVLEELSQRWKSGVKK